MSRLTGEQQQHQNPSYSECYIGGWDIRLYEQQGQWLACFNHVDLWHEHVTAESKEDVLTLARSTIDTRIAEGK